MMELQANARLQLFFFVCPDTILPACDELYYTHTPLSLCVG